MVILKSHPPIRMEKGGSRKGKGGSRKGKGWRRGWERADPQNKERVGPEGNFEISPYQITLVTVSKRVGQRLSGLSVKRAASDQGRTHTHCHRISVTRDRAVSPPPPVSRVLYSILEVIMACAAWKEDWAARSRIMFDRYLIGPNSAHPLHFSPEIPPAHSLCFVRFATWL